MRIAAELRSITRKGRRPRRVGAATLEFAIVAPIVFFLVLALMQFAGLLMSQNVLTNAAREGGRVASMPGTISSTTVVNAVEDYLALGGIDPDDVEVEVSPANLSTVVTGDELRVSVSAPLEEMTWIWVVAPPSAELSSEATYRRE